MGITGLLPILKPICESKHVDAFAQRRVGIDASSWLHKGAFSCALDLATGAPTARFVDYCMHRVRMLLHFGAVPVLVFDGAPLPMKAATNARRRETRAAACEAGRKALLRGDRAAAAEAFQRGIEITHDMARQLIKAIRKLNVEYVVAPYEADAQLAWLATNGHVDLVVTEDSDLVVYGAPRILYKMSKCGQGELFESKNITALDDPDFRNFTPQMLTSVCVLAGCDFFPGVQGLGIRKAHTLVKRSRTVARVLQVVRFDPKYSVPSEFVELFYRASLVFKHQTVYDCNTHRNVHLYPLDATARASIPESVLKPCSESPEDLAFLGSFHDAATASQLARGEMNPRTLKAYADPLDVVERPIDHHVEKSPPRTPAGRQQGQTKGFQSYKAGTALRSSFFTPSSNKDRLSSVAELFRRPVRTHIGSTAAVREAFNPPRRLLTSTAVSIPGEGGTIRCSLSNQRTPSATPKRERSQPTAFAKLSDRFAERTHKPLVGSEGQQCTGLSLPAKMPNSCGVTPEVPSRPPSPDADVLDRFAAIDDDLFPEPKDGEMSGTDDPFVLPSIDRDWVAVPSTDIPKDTHEVRKLRRGGDGHCPIVLVSPFFDTRRLSLPLSRNSPTSQAKRRKVLASTRITSRATHSVQQRRAKTLANLDALRHSGLSGSNVTRTRAGHGTNQSNLQS
jgi:exonuclease 1